MHTNLVIDQTYKSIIYKHYVLINFSCGKKKMLKSKKYSDQMQIKHGNCKKKLKQEH